jgi:hypothetical protein
MKTLLQLGRLAFALGLVAVSPAGTRALASVDGVDTSTDHLWSDIKADTYDQRDHTEKGADRMIAKLDQQIRELKAKRAAMTTDTKDWDLAMKEVDDSRVLLVGTTSDLKAATTPETWIDARDKLGAAWKRSQLAVDNMNSTRTS